MRFVDEIFDRRFDRDSGARFEDMLFERCTFDNCGFSMTKRIDRRSAVRSTALRECTVISSDVGPGLFEDVLVDTLKTPETMIVWSPCFKHVVLRGKMGRIKINRAANFKDRSVELQGAFDAARVAFYSEVDWALDISEAEFQQFDISGVPVRLIRRDPRTQAIVQRSRAEDRSWRSRIAAWNTHWPRVIDVMLGEQDDGFLLVAPKAVPKKRFQAMVDGLQNLRDLGVADQE